MYKNELFISRVSPFKKKNEFVQITINFSSSINDYVWKLEYKLW